MAVCRPAISCRTPVPVWNVPVWNRPAVGGQGTGIARVSATGPTGCHLRLCRPDIPGRRFTPRPACLPADHPCIKPQTEPDRRAGLPDRKRRDQGTGQDGGQGRAVHGVVPGLACGGVTGRTGPAHVNPVISHRHPDICPDETRGRAIPPARAGAGPRPGPHVRPGSCHQGRCSSGRPGSRMQGTTSMPVSRAVGTRSCPGNNGVAPGGQDGTGKTGHPDRRRDLPDLIRRTGTGIPHTGGFRARGHPSAAARSPEWGQDRSTSRRAKGFLPLAMPGFLTFFSPPVTAGIAQIPAQPLRRFPRAFQGGISFRAQGPFRFR